MTPTNPRCPKCGTPALDWHDDIRKGWCGHCQITWKEPDVDWLRSSHDRLIAAMRAAYDAIRNDDGFHRRHAAENQYCPRCFDERNDDSWKDQEFHKPNCPWVAMKSQLADALAAEPTP